MKNKIFKYDFLIVGAGLIGSLAAIELFQKNTESWLLKKTISFLKMIEHWL